MLAWIDHDASGRGRGFAMLGFYMEDASGNRGAGAQQVIADLLALAVLPTFQRHGIGSKLLAHVIDVAERVAPSSHIGQLRLTVAEDNVGAQRLYARTGFTVVDGSATYDRSCGDFGHGGRQTAPAGPQDHPVEGPPDGHRVTELRTAREKLRVNAFDVRAQYAQAMSRAVAQVELAKRRVGLSQQAIDLANQNIKIETDRFNLGRSTNFDVLNRLEDLRQAELRKAQALVDWHKGEALVVGLTGEILPLYGVTLD